MNLTYFPKHIKIVAKESESEKTHKELNRIACLLFKNNDPYLKQEFGKTFEKLYDQCTADKYYWQYCTADVYRQTFNIRLDTYLKTYSDAKPADFINLEFSYLATDLRLTNPEITGMNFRDQNYNFLDENNYMCAIKIKTIISDAYRKRIFYSNQRKYEFIRDMNNPSEFVKDEKSFDYSDNSVAEQIVFMHELGILDFLMKKLPRGMSVNRLAGIISCFSGINQTTIQSYLNPIFSKKADSKNSPLTPKNLKSVHEKLSKMGFSSFITA